jgi:hypothetical protein
MPRKRTYPSLDNPLIHKEIRKAFRAKLEDTKKRTNGVLSIGDRATISQKMRKKTITLPKMPWD